MRAGVIQRRLGGEGGDGDNGPFLSMCSIQSVEFTSRWGKGRGLPEKGRNLLN